MSHARLLPCCQFESCGPLSTALVLLWPLQVLQLLGSVEGLRVVELGAGIGRWVAQWGQQTVWRAGQ